MQRWSMRAGLVSLICMLAGACVSPTGAGSRSPTPPPPASPSPTDPSGFGGGPRTLDLGDWSRSDAGATQTSFVRSLEAAARPGESMSETLDTMRENGFGCSPSSARSPAHICERQFLRAGCTHTWQVLLFGEGRLSEARGGYDRVCRDATRPGGGLLGAPPG